MQIKRAKTVAEYLSSACRTAILIASLNSRVFCSSGMGPNVAVLHVDDSNFASGLLNFNF
jgi:hypothetical protein